MWQWPVGACAFQVTVSTSCCCPLQLFRVVGGHALLVSSAWTPVSKRALSHRFASMRSLDQEKVCPRIDNAEITDFNFKRNNTLTCWAICRSLLVSCPPGTIISSYRRLISFSSGCHLFCCLFGPTARHILLVSCPSGVCLCRSLLGAMSRQVPCCRVTDPPFLRSGGQPYAYALVSHPRTQLVFASVCGFITSSIGNTKGKLFTKKAINHMHLFEFDLLQGIFAVLTAYAVSSLLPLWFPRSLSPVRWPVCQSISECAAGKRVRPIRCEQIDRHTLLFYRYRCHRQAFVFAKPSVWMCAGIEIRCW